MFRSFAPYSHVFPLILASLLLLSLLDAASGAQFQQNVTVRFNSTQVSFTPGWRVAEFTKTGRVDKFAFANNPGEQLIIKLPRNVTTLSYRGFKVKGGAQYFVCLDCDEGTDATPNSFTVDAHDESDNGTQPPVTLFQVKEVNPKQTHVLRVINLEDDRFNDTSQITFESLVLTLIDEDTVNTSGPAGSPASTTPPGVTSTNPNGNNPTTTFTVNSTGRSPSAPSGTSASKPPTPSVSATQSTTSGVATTSTSASNPQGPTMPVNSGGGSTNQPSSSPSATSSGSQPQTASSATGSGGLQPISTAGSAPGSSPSSGISSGPNPTSSSSSPQPANATPNSGVSKTVIIVVAVIASLFVLALLAAITWLLVRNQPSPRGDIEGTTGLMRQAVPAVGTGITVSGPLPLSPMRPEIPNPFVDPLDDLIQSPPPQPAPPPVPPRSPLRTANFSGDRPAWLTRTPRTPSPEASNE